MLTFEMIRLRREQNRLDRLIRAELHRLRPDLGRVAELRRVENAVSARLAQLARERGVDRRRLRLADEPAFA